LEFELRVIEEDAWKLSLRLASGSTTVLGLSPCIAGIAITKLCDLRSNVIGVPRLPAANPLPSPAARPTVEPLAKEEAIAETSDPPYAE
jgi:hypothetical protein